MLWTSNAWEAAPQKSLINRADDRFPSATVQVRRYRHLGCVIYTAPM